MSIFNSATDFTDFKSYTDLLKKAMIVVLPGTKAHFAYFKEYQFADKKRPCVLVDYGPKFLDSIKAAKKATPTAMGKVTLTLANQILFLPEHGECKSEVLKKFFESLGGGFKEVFVEGDGAGAAGQNPAAKPAPAGAAALKQQGNAAGSAAATAAPKAAPTPPPKSAAAAKVAQAAQAPPARPNRPAAVAPMVKVEQHDVFDTFLMPNKEDERAPAIKGLIEALAKAKLPITDDHKNTVLAQARKFLDSGDLVRALKVVNTVARTVKYPGVAPWALDAASRRYEFGVFIEQCFAMRYLIDQKRAPGSKQCDAEKAAATKMSSMISNFNGTLEQGLLDCDPAVVKAAYEGWVRLEQERKKVAERLKPLWVESQNKRMLDEAGKSKASRNIKVANSYGKEAILEFAQMAEVQAVKFQQENKNDPLAQGNWHKKLEVAELAAIYGYTTADFTPVGNLLRAKQDTQQERDALKDQFAKYGEYIEAAKAGLAKLPVYTGQGAIRCTKSLWQETIDQIAATGIHVEKSFMSVGKKKVPGFGNIEWHFENIKTGKDITMFSLHQTEGEVLFPPNSRFKFLRGEVEDSDGHKIPLANRTELGQHTTPDTKVGTLIFEQVG